MAKIVNRLAYRHSPHTVFSDCIEMAALAMSNAVDKAQWDAREARYLEIARRYNQAEINEVPKFLGELTLAFEDRAGDHLGTLFHELELHNTYKGQFFTPYDLCRMMAMMTFDEDAHEIIGRRGFITASEPACGAGAMVIALAETMQAAGINYQQALHVTAVDVDPRCIHMAYLQFSLMHIPAVIVHGNTLTLEEFGHWYTPAHIMGLWDVRLRAMRRNEKSGHPPSELQAVACDQPPVLTITEPEAPTSRAKPVQLTLF